jgi:hypothetical protein
VATKKSKKTNFFPPIFVAVVGFGIQSGMDKNQDPGSGTNIPDLQYWSRPFFLFTIPYGRYDCTDRYLLYIVQSL